jgi:colicin import membrane protein
MRYLHFLVVAALFVPLVCFSDENSTQASTRLLEPEGAAWARQISMAVRRNLKVPLGLTGTPRADVEIRLAADGTIEDSQLFRSSGVESWDSAALDAVRKTERLPKAANGKLPTRTVVIAFVPW